MLDKPRHIRTTHDSIKIRGRVLHYEPGCRVNLRTSGHWHRVRLTATGGFQLRFASLPEGLTKVAVRVTDTTGRRDTIRLQIRRRE